MIKIQTWADSFGEWSARVTANGDSNLDVWDAKALAQVAIRAELLYRAPKDNILAPTRLVQSGTYSMVSDDDATKLSTSWVFSEVG